MKTTLEENNINNLKVNNGINKSANNNSFISKDSNKQSLNRLSESNIEFDDTKNKDLRCLNCYLIPFLTLDSSSRAIDINCNFGHGKKINLDEYLQCGYNNNFINLACSKCKTQISRVEMKNYIYCKECSEILCNKCLIKHDNMYSEHHMVNLEKYDTTCILHNETYDYFCLDCKKNICQYCSDDFHSDHQFVDLDDINLKRKEIKIIKANFLKEKDNYSNIPSIFNDLIIKLKNELELNINYIQNEIQFKESIINTYENKIDNYNAIMNFKKLAFNTKPFNVDKNSSTLENIINLMNYINTNDTKLNDIKREGKKKSSTKNKIKKKSTKNSKNDKNEKIDKSETNDDKKEKAEKNDKSDKNEVNDSNIIEEQSKNNMNSQEKNNINTIYKKNIVTKKISFNISNDKKIINENFEHRSSNKIPIPIPKEMIKINEEKPKIFLNVNKNKPPEFLEISEKNKNEIEKEDFYLNNNNLNEENEIQNNINNFGDKKITSYSTNNINYIKSEPPKSKLSLKSNKSLHIKEKKNINSDDKIKNNSLSGKNKNSNNNSPLALIKLFNKNEASNKRQNQLETNLSYNILNKENYRKEKEKRILKDLRNIKIDRSGKKIKEKNDLESSEEDEEEEEEEDDDEDSEEESENGEENEDEESDENYEEDEKKVINMHNQKRLREIKRINYKENDDANKIINDEENEESFRHKKVYPVNLPQNMDYSDLSKNKTNFKEISKNDIKSKNIKLMRDLNVNEFRPKSTNSKIKESNNTVCCIIEVKDNIFACGFLLGEIDIYNVSYLTCLFTILEHKSRISNMFLLKDKSILTSSYDYTMKKIRLNNNSYTVEFVFKIFKNIVYKGIELDNSDIISISFRGNIDIFKKEYNNNYKSYKQHEIADEEIYNIIELFPTKEIALSTDECLRFFSIDTYQNIGSVHLLEFAKGNNMIHFNKITLIVLLKHDLGLINIPLRQTIYKFHLGNIGKPENICHLKDNSILACISNSKSNQIQFMFKQFNIKLNKLKLIAEKLEEFEKKKKDDYFRITSLLQLKNKIIVYGTAGFEDFKLVGNISIID